MGAEAEEAGRAGTGGRVSDDHERDVLFVRADGRSHRAPVYRYLDVWITREYPRGGGASVVDSDCPPAPAPHIERVYHRHSRLYPPNWQGPLESGSWWCPEPRRSHREPMPPGIVMYVFVEACAPAAAAELFEKRWWP